MNEMKQKSVHQNRREATFHRYVADWVGRKAPAWAVEAAVGYFVEHRRMNDEDIDECAKLARMIFAAQARAPSGLPIATPGTLLESEELSKAMRPAVLEVRRALFGRRSTPFSSISSAARWIETQAEPQWHPSAGERDRALAQVKSASAAVAPLGWRIRIEVRDLAYLTQEGIRRVPVLPGGPLAVLEEEAATLAREAVVSVPSVVAHILVGIPPLIPLVRLTVEEQFPGLRARVQVARKWVTLEIHHRDITFARLRRIYETVRGALGVARRKAVSQEQQDPFKLVAELGGEPPAGAEQGGDATGPLGARPTAVE